jgi:hypothetical protein
MVKKKKKKTPKKKDRVKMREERAEREKKRIREKLERTVEELSPHNHLVTLTVGKQTKEAYRELKKVFNHMFTIQCKIDTHSHYSSGVEFARKLLDSVFENSHKGIRISRNVYFLPGVKTKSFEVKLLNDAFKTWTINSIRMTTGESNQFEKPLIDRAIEVRNDFLERVGNQPMKTKYTTALSAKWINEKIVWLRQLAEAMGSKKAHRMVDSVCAERDKYCHEAGWNLPVFAEVQKVIAESSNVDYQDTEVSKWVDWSSEECLLMTMEDGTLARDRLEKYSLKFIAAARQFMNEPNDMELEYEFRKSKTRLLENAERWILPVDRSRRRHPYGDRDEEKMFFPKKGEG